MEKNVLMTIGEVAEHLRLSRWTVRRYVRDGVLPASKIGRFWRVRPQDLEKFIEERLR